MVKRRSIILFLLALLMAATAAWIANNWLLSRQQINVVHVQAATLPVVTAALRIPFGQKIEEVHLTTIQMPKEIAPENGFTDTKDVVGKIAKQGMVPGEIIINERVVEQLGGSTLSAIVNPNMRAVTVRVNDVVGVAGFLLPGNRVDVLSTRHDRTDQKAVTRTILQDIKVLAVDQTASPEKEQPVIVRAVTLELAPDQAEVLVNATNEGSVQLTLRNPIDTEKLAEAQPEAPKPVAPAPVQRSYSVPSVTIIRGAQVNKTDIRI